MAVSEKNKKRIQVQLDRQLADEAEEVLDGLGINQTTALTAFYKRIVAVGGMPFDLKLTPREQANLKIKEMSKSLPNVKINNSQELDRLYDNDDGY